jgi:hypothetical protein
VQRRSQVAAPSPNPIRDRTTHPASETFTATVGRITISDARIVLIQRDGATFEWSAGYQNGPTATEQLLPKVIAAVLRRDKQYKRHPVVKEREQHLTDQIASLRRFGVRVSHDRFRKVESELLKIAGPDAVRAAKQPYKSFEKIIATIANDIRDALQPIYDVWKESLKRDVCREDREEYVIRNVFPQIDSIGCLPNYSAIVKARIGRCVEIFETVRFDSESYVTLPTIIDNILKMVFGSVNLINLRRGRQLLKKPKRND